MNACIPMPDGSLHALTPHDAALLDAYLGARLPHVAERDQATILREIDHLRRITDPMRAYEEWGVG